MASSNLHQSSSFLVVASDLDRHSPFVVCPIRASIYVWKVVATATNQTISRHKDLEPALRKAQELNRRALRVEASVPVNSKTQTKGEFQCHSSQQ